VRKALTADGDVTTPTLGFLVNPVAGMGGSVGLKGTDGVGILREAKRRGALPGAETRAVRALKRLAATTSSFRVLSGPDEMGATAARAAGLMPEMLGRSNSGDSTAADTIVAAHVMAERAVDLILFVGGDGTARDVLAAGEDEESVVVGCRAFVETIASTGVRISVLRMPLVHRGVAPPKERLRVLLAANTA
jgi:predicted polyphosphate/ATP-dependent NAD kinase